MAVLRIGSSQFKLNPLALVLTLLAIALMIKLGFWQIDRGNEKQQIIDRNLQADIRGVAQLSELNGNEIADARDQQIQFVGKVLPRPIILIENQIHNGQVGYHVISMVHVERLNQVVPVNFGWVPAEQARTVDPVFELPIDTLETFEGSVHIPEAPFLLHEQLPAEQPSEGLVRLQYPELDVLETYLQAESNLEEMSPYMVRLSPQESSSWVREWPVVVMPPHKHYAYAVQWFGLALAALIIFLFACRVRQPKH